MIGIVASRLAERHRRPVVLLSLDGESGRGSGRSIEGYDLLAGLTACSERLVRYGGHSAAAGVELARADVTAFAAALDAPCPRAALSPEQLIPRERVDAIVGGGQLDMELAEELATLGPFGRGNPAVTLDGEGRRAGRRAARWGRASTRASRCNPRACTRARWRSATTGSSGWPRAGRRRDVHARGERVERGERAADGAPPRPTCLRGGYA